jgi:hypothetical protein
MLTVTDWNLAAGIAELMAEDPESTLATAIREPEE